MVGGVDGVSSNDACVSAWAFDPAGSETDAALGARSREPDPSEADGAASNESDAGALGCAETASGLATKGMVGDEPFGCPMPMVFPSSRSASE